jgi:hypothetical protein
MMLIMCLFEDCNFDPYQKIINSIVIMRNRNIKSIKHSQIIYRKKKKLFINSYSNCFGFYFTFVFILFYSFFSFLIFILHLNDLYLHVFDLFCLRFRLFILFLFLSNNAIAIAVLLLQYFFH